MHNYTEELGKHEKPKLKFNLPNLADHRRGGMELT
jgi:hypothetical protein